MNCVQIGSNSRLAEPSSPLHLFEALAKPTDLTEPAKKALTTITLPCLTALFPYFCTPSFRKISTTVLSIASYFQRLLILIVTILISISGTGTKLKGHSIKQKLFS